MILKDLEYALADTQYRFTILLSSCSYNSNYDFNTTYEWEDPLNEFIVDHYNFIVRAIYSSDKALHIEIESPTVCDERLL